MVLDGRLAAVRGRLARGPLLTDGSPVWLPWCEAWLVGAGFWAAPDDLQIASIEVQPEDFRDSSLGTIWGTMLNLETISIVTVIAALDAVRVGGPAWGKTALDEVGGESRIVDLATAPQAFLNAGPVSILAHAEVVKDWSRRRAGIEAAAVAAQRAYAGIGPRFVPIHRRAGYQGEMRRSS